MERTDRVIRLIRMCDDEINNLMSVGGLWIMPSDVFRKVCKGMPHVEKRFEQIWNRRDSLKRLRFKL